MDRNVTVDVDQVLFRFFSNPDAIACHPVLSLMRLRISVKAVLTGLLRLSRMQLELWASILSSANTKRTTVCKRYPPQPLGAKVTGRASCSFGLACVVATGAGLRRRRLELGRDGHKCRARRAEEETAKRRALDKRFVGDVAHVEARR